MSQIYDSGCNRRTRFNVKMVYDAVLYYYDTDDDGIATINLINYRFPTRVTEATLKLTDTLTSPHNYPSSRLIGVFFSPLDRREEYSIIDKFIKTFGNPFYLDAGEIMLPERFWASVIGSALRSNSVEEYFSLRKTAIEQYELFKLRMICLNLARIIWGDPYYDYPFYKHF